MVRQLTPIFDINKPFPKQFGKAGKLLVKFQKPYTIYLQSSLDPPFILEDIEFLSRFKRAIYDGRIAPLIEMKGRVMPPTIMTCIDIETRRTSFLDLINKVEYFVQGKYLESLASIEINPDHWIETHEPKVMGDKRFAEELIEYYKLENIYNTKLMKIYNSGYFEGAGSSNEKIETESLDLFVPQSDGDL